MKKKEFALTNYYHNLIYNIQDIKNFEELDNISILLKNDLESENYLTLKHLFIFKLSNTYFSKALILKKKFRNKNLPYSFKIILRLLKKNGFVSPLYKTVFEKFEEKNVFKDTPKKIIKKKNVINTYRKNLKEIFQLTKKEDLNVGYSLIDINGNFLWSSEKSDILFENFTKNKIKNFFDLLIPFSKNLLFNKFNNGNSESFSLFKEETKLGKKISFSYIIYSQIKINKFEKYLNDLNLKNFKDYQKILLNNEKELTIFNRYLKELRSRCKLIIIKLFKKDLFNIIFHEDEKIIFYTKNLKLIKLSRSDLLNQDNIYLKQNDFLYKKVIYLETRKIKKKLNFDYRFMKDDLIIKKIEKDIILKFTKNLNKKNLE